MLFDELACLADQRALQSEGPRNRRLEQSGFRPQSYDSARSTFDGLVKGAARLHAAARPFLNVADAACRRQSSSDSIEFRRTM
jgi:hypothetical protein